MLFTIAVILVILWLLGIVTSYTMGGFIHVLLVIAIVVVLVRLIRGRNIVDGTKNCCLLLNNFQEKNSVILKEFSRNGINSVVGSARLPDSIWIGHRSSGESLFSILK